MSWTDVERANGLGMIASNSILDATGTPHAVSDDVLDAAASPHTVFGATVEVNPIKIISFRLSDATNRMFRL